ncbi:hypothetical protein ABZP36_002259 [Zizania latifolia]
MKENGEELAPATSVPYMCLDMVYEIFLRLPAADVHRCRFVCSQWHALAHLVVTHRQRRSPMPMFFYRRNFFLGPLGPEENPSIDRFDLQAVNLVARESRRVLGFVDVIHPEEVEFDELDPYALVDPQQVMFRIEGSCDGILVLSSPDALYACNPFTRHWALLPSVHHGDILMCDPPAPQGNGILAFYARGPPGEGREYRLLYQTAVGPPPPPPPPPVHTYWLYLLGAGAEGQHIGLPMSPVMQPELGAVLLGGLPVAFVRPPILFQGSLHWPPIFLQPIQNYKIVVFDTVMEEFSWINPPSLADAENGVILNWAEINLFQLLNIKGELALAMINTDEWPEGPDAEIEVWLLTDYGSETWELRYRIGPMPPTVINDHDYDEVRDPPLYLVSRAGAGLDLLVMCPYTLLQYDAHWAQRQCYGRPNNWIVGTGYQLEENFVLHPFLAGQGNNENPPFFHFHEP